MIRGFKNLRGIVAAFLVAASVVCAVPANTLTAEAASVHTYEYKTALNEDGEVVDASTPTEIIYIKPGVYNRNVLQVKVMGDDMEDSLNHIIKSISCSKTLRYKITYRNMNNKGTVATFRFSFYTKKQKIYNFKFRVDGIQYKVKINSQQPVKEIKFGNQLLTNTSDALGSYNCITELKKGKVSVKMNSQYSMTSLQVGRYKNVKNGSNTTATLYWETIKNNKKVKLSNERQVTTFEGSNGFKATKEESMVATTIIRVNYKNNKTGVTGYVDYYLNRLLD